MRFLLYLRPAPGAPWTLRIAASSRVGAQLIGGALLESVQAQGHAHAAVLVLPFLGPLGDAPETIDA